LEIEEVDDFFHALQLAFQNPDFVRILLDSPYFFEAAKVGLSKRMAKESGLIYGRVLRQGAQR
jgi:hypothetical protein